MPIDPKFRKQISYIEEGFDNYLRREFDWKKPDKDALQSEEVRLPGDKIDWNTPSLPPSPTDDPNIVKGAGVMVIAGTLANGSDKALPNLYVTKSCEIYEIAGQLKTITSGTVQLDIVVNNVILTSLLISNADSLKTISIPNYGLNPNDKIDIDVLGTYAGAQDATVFIRIKQKVE